MANGESGSPRARQRNRQQRVADELGIDPDQVAVRDTLDRGTEANLTSRGATAAERARRSEFASEADFVNEQDVTAEADRKALSVSARIAKNRRDDVEQRAESSVAEESDYVTPADLDADVGKRGVEGVAIPEEQRDDVAQRATSDAAETYPYADKDDLDAAVGRRGVKSVSIDEDAKNELADQAAADFASQSEYVSADDVQATIDEDGVSDVKIAEEKQSEVASRVREDVLSDLGDAAKASDVAVKVSESGVEKAEVKDGRRKDIAARQIDDQISSVSIDSSDIQRSGDGFAPKPSVLKQAAAAKQNPTAQPDEGDLREFVSRNFDLSSDKVDEFVSKTNGGFSTNEFVLPFDASQGNVEKAIDLRNAVSDGETVDASRFGTISPETTASPSDFRVSVSSAGDRQVELRDSFNRQLATERFDAQLESVDISTGDVRQTAQGYQPTDSVLKESAANQLGEFERSRVDAQRLVDEFSDSSALSANEASEIINTAGGRTLPADDVIDISAREGEALSNEQVTEIAATGSVDFGPSDFAIDETADGREVALRSEAQQQRVAVDLDTRFQGADIGVDDVERTDDGFGLETDAQREIAAEQFEEQTPLGNIDPQNDLEQQPDGDGFALAGDAQREFAAQQFEQETALEDVNPNTGLTRGASGFGLSTIGQRRLAAEQFEEQTELEEVDPQQDILLNDDGSAALAGRTEERLAADLLDDQVDADVSVDDVDRVTNPDGSTEFEFTGVR